MIYEINVADQNRWNETVRSFADYDVYYLNEYAAAFMRVNDSNGIPALIYYENGADRAINVVFKRDIASDEKMKGKIEPERFYDLISPYGYGGFWGKVDDYEALNRAYNEYCMQNGFICEFVRFELFGEYSRHYDGEVETRTHNVVRSLDISLDEMWMDFKQKVRKNVKHAISNNLGIIIENTDAHLKDFIDIYYSTMDRTNAEDQFYFTEEFFRTLNELRDNVMYFYVEHEGRIISAELVIYGAENAYSYLGGTNRDYFELRPNDFLKYEVIKWAKNKGLKNFVLGGGYGSDDGIFQYKTCLAPNGIVDFYIGRKIFDADRYQQLVDIRKADNPDCLTSSFFPKYRT